MKQMNLRIIICFLAICAAHAAEGQSPVEKVTADYNQVRSDAIKPINQKYIQYADAEVKITLKSGDLQQANAINDWSKHLAGTDDKENTGGTASGAGSERLSVLQTAYLKERSEAVLMVDKSYEAYVQAAMQQAMKDGDLDGANAANKLLTAIKTELGDTGQASTAGKPFGVKSGNSTTGNNIGSSVVATPSPTAAPVIAGGGSAPAPTPTPSASGFVPGVGFNLDGNGFESQFSGTVWISISHIGGSNGQTATLTFRPDGTWAENYPPNPVKGRWKVTKDHDVVEVTLANGGKISDLKVVHFKISDNGTKLTRVESSVVYALKK